MIAKCTIFSGFLIKNQTWLLNAPPPTAMMDENNRGAAEASATPFLREICRGGRSQGAVEACNTGAN